MKQIIDIMYVGCVVLLLVLSACGGSTSDEATEYEEEETTESNATDTEEEAKEEEPEETNTALLLTPISVGNFKIGMTITVLKEQMPSNYEFKEGALEDDLLFENPSWHISCDTKFWS